ncbi:glycosyl hydrolase family 28 protein [Enterococcus timonensis]|uniref:glycosyl hydrolase family 28 protein n=1 Tax=Enterococcus timonensis TaxID=1852364 RepID=UPI0008DA0CC1|nr:glycosyl hydrolase family 28 protein [Enterococcus timonensis]
MFPNYFKLSVAPGTLAHDSVTLIWDKPTEYHQVLGYQLFQNGQPIIFRPTNKTHFTVRNLQPKTRYQFTLQMQGVSQEKPMTLTIITKETPVVIDVTKDPYEVDCTGKKLATNYLQQAIDDCPKDGIVWIPSKTNVLSGALQLKSNMTLQVDGVLQGSLNPADYISTNSNQGMKNEDQLILSRYEGWELFCYRSLLNAGFIMPENRQQITCENIRICGQGKIIGGGNELATEMKKIYQDKKLYPKYVSDGLGGRRVRGRLICFSQCKNVHLTQVTLEKPSGWTVHLIYCDTVTTHGLAIHSKGIDNGDGWDPDSSKNCLIFDTTFDTGDDCIAIKSGKNPEGNQINIPAENIRIFDLQMQGGNGMAIGSEESGGIKNIYIRDCHIENTRYGLEVKAHCDRGGYLDNLLVLDCRLDHFLVHSVKYNSDGFPAENLPIFKNITLKNSEIISPQKAVELTGFYKNTEQKSYLKNIVLENIILQQNNNQLPEVAVNLCQDVYFKNIKTIQGTKLLLNLGEDNRNLVFN